MVNFVKMCLIYLTVVLSMAVSSYGFIGPFTKVKWPIKFPVRPVINPCLRHCPLYTTSCKMLPGGHAICQCPKACTRDYKPICGSDWNTYSNFCQLKRKSCTAKQNIKFKYNGECKAGECRRSLFIGRRFYTCPYNSKCILNFGLPSCVCPQLNCPSQSKPVCGTDGVTYRNECEMKETSCKKRKYIYINKKYKGGCGVDPCLAKKCCCGAKSCKVLHGGIAACQCSRLCPTIFDPVCGSDGKTYSSSCTLGVARCTKQNPKLLKVGKGPCSPPLTPCATVRCGYYAICKVIAGKAKCVCNEACTKILKPVCGNDGVTYSNLCLLKVAYCKSQKAIGPVINGPCKPKRCPKGGRAFCIIPCLPKVCNLQGQVCCCSGAGQACAKCTNPVKAYNGLNVCPPKAGVCKVDKDCPKAYECCPNGCDSSCMKKILI